jgi:hypothetical protein
MDYLLHLLIILTLCTKISYAGVTQSHANPKVFEDLKYIVGEYQGEVRMQSSDGLVNRLMVREAKVKLSISGDELIFTPISDIVGEHCQSSVGGIRELVKAAPDQGQVLRAEFDFKTGHCSSFSKLDTVLVLLEKNPEGALTLETLLVESSAGRETYYPLEQKKNIHGYFSRMNIKSPDEVRN